MRKALLSFALVAFAALQTVCAQTINVPVTVVNGTMDDVQIFDKSMNDVVVENGALSFEAEDMPLYVMTSDAAYAQGIDVVSIEVTGPEGASVNEVYFGSWQVRDLVEGNALVITLTDLNAPAAADITVPVEVIGAEVEDLYITGKDYMPIYVTDGVITVKAGQQPISLESWGSDDISAIEVTEGTAKVEKVADWGLWQVSQMEQGTALRVYFGSLPDAINNVKGEENATDLYNIQGVKTQRPAARGIYVRNGKKFIVR